ncbi:MAG: metal ABC transporter substrate-binding protein [Nocardioidaceae bacterium]
MKGLRIVAAMAAIAPAVTACGGSSADASSGPNVVASFYPYAFVAERVAGDHATVTNLTAPGLEPHDLELTPQQVADIEDATVVVYEKGFQPAVDEAVDQNAQGLTLDTTSVVPLEDTGAPAEPNDPGEPSLTGDPHVWLDPIRLASITEAVAAELSRADPVHAAAYRANGLKLVARLHALDRDYAAGLADCKRTQFVTSHAAFGYLAQRYGLQMIAISGLSPDAEPSPQRLSELESLVRQDGITTIFSEVLASPALADTLAGEVGVKTAVLDPIEGLPAADSQQNYLTIMRANLAALRQSNGCR